MKLKMIAMLFVLVLLLTAQVTYIPADNPQVRLVRGDDLQWYIFCENRCLPLLSAVSVDDLYRRYGTAGEAIDRYQEIYRLMP